MKEDQEMQRKGITELEYDSIIFHLLSVITKKDPQTILALKVWIKHHTQDPKLDKIILIDREPINRVLNVVETTVESWI